MEFKYLSDGRKVAVLGKLNSQEMIVQEIFITAGGDEIPSGESFTVKSLHDEPVVSYQQKSEQAAKERLKRIEKDIAKAKQELNKINITLGGYRDILRSTKKLVDLFDEQDLYTLTSFMTGTIKYLVVDGYRISKPVKMIDKVISYEFWDGTRYDGIKLCSVLGRSDGSLSYKINQYCDGSGSNTAVYPFTNLEDALEHIKSVALNKIDSKSGLSEEEFNLCIEMGIKFGEDAIKKYEDKINSDILKNIESKKKAISEAQENIGKLSSKLKGTL